MTNYWRGTRHLRQAAAGFGCSFVAKQNYLDTGCTSCQRGKQTKDHTSNGVPLDDVDVSGERFGRGEKSQRPTLLYLQAAKSKRGRTYRAAQPCKSTLPFASNRARKSLRWSLRFLQNLAGPKR